MAILEDDYIKKILYRNYVIKLQEMKQSLFLSACYQRDFETVKSLINAGYNVNEVCRQGYNGLQHLISSLGAMIPTVFNLRNGSTIYRPINRKNRVEYFKFAKTFMALINGGIDINYMNPNDNINALSIALEVDGYIGDYIVDTLIKAGCERKVIEICPSHIYEYQDDWDFPDISCLDFVIFKDLPRLFRYIHRIKKNKIEVYCNTYGDGYNRPKKLIKDLKKFYNNKQLSEAE